MRYSKQKSFRKKHPVPIRKSQFKSRIVDGNGSNSIVRLGNKIATANLVPGTSVYGENLIRENNLEFREWDPKRSKLCSAIKKGLRNLAIKRGSNILYLGAASGTTVSHISDIVDSGCIFAVEFSPEVGRSLILLSKTRKNIVPVISDASSPDKYFHRVLSVDVLYQDVAQRNQTKILIDNSDLFLKKGGIAYLCVKSRSIDVTLRPREVFASVKKDLSEKFKIIQEIDLYPFQKDHRFYVLEKL